MNTSAGKPPWHLWAVGVLSLLWNGFGGYDYTMSQLRDRAYLEAAMEPMGMTYEQAVAWLDSFPVWAAALWAIGVWSSVAGALLLLLRSRHAATAFLVSFVAAAINFAYQFATPQPEALSGSDAMIMPLVVLVAIILQWWYARRQAAAGVLR